MEDNIKIKQTSKDNILWKLFRIMVERETIPGKTSKNIEKEINKFFRESQKDNEKNF